MSEDAAQLLAEVSTKVCGTGYLFLDTNVADRPPWKCCVGWPGGYVIGYGSTAVSAVLDARQKTDARHSGLSEADKLRRQLCFIEEDRQYWIRRARYVEVSSADKLNRQTKLLELLKERLGDKDGGG